MSGDFIMDETRLVSLLAHADAIPFAFRTTDFELDILADCRARPPESNKSPLGLAGTTVQSELRRRLGEVPVNAPCN
jgi:hypothetical protein